MSEDEYLKELRDGSSKICDICMKSDTEDTEKTGKLTNITYDPKTELYFCDDCMIAEKENQIRAKVS